MAVRRGDLLDRATGAALAAAAAAAIVLAVRLGAAASVSDGDLVAELRARVQERVRVEREQIRPILEAVGRGERAAAGREAAAAAARLEGNSQLHLLLAQVHRAAGRDADALGAYRKAVELVRDYTDRRSPFFIGTDLKAWICEVKPRVTAGGAAAGTRDLHYLERALAGGCS
jgi:hypothetical protein